MATATVLSATVARKLWSPSSFYSRSAACHRCCQNGPLFCIDIPRRALSRRDAITFFLQGALVSAPNSNAQALESGYGRVKGLEHVQFKNELEMKVLVDASPVPETMQKLPLGKLAGFVLAYQGAQKSSGSNLGFLGCLVFGLLFLKEKQLKAASMTSLEDVQVRIKQADTELCSQTRSSVRYKLEESQLQTVNGRNTSLSEALQHQLKNAKFSVVERGKQLDVKKKLSELFNKQANGLTASVKEIEKDCISLLGRVDNQLNIRHELEAELQSVVAELECKANKYSSLKACMVNQEEANNEVVEKLAEVERSLEKSNKHVLDAEKKVESLRNSLLVTDGSADSLVKELRYTTRNETLEGELNELSRNLQSEQAAFARHLAEQNELLIIRENDVDAHSAELLSEQNEQQRNWRSVSQLTKQRDELMMAVSEKRITLDDLKEMLDSSQERRRTVQNEFSTLHEQLFHEQARSTALEADLEKNVLALLSKMSVEVENQINTEKEMAGGLEKEFHITSQALSESKVEISALQDKMQLLLSSQAQLQGDMARLKEEQQAVCQALKKEKRAAAYAKKQLTLSKEILSEDNRVMKELCNDLEKARRLIEDSKGQILVKVSELERVTETEKRSTDDDFQSKSALSAPNKEQPLQVNLDGRDEIPTSVGKPIRRRNVTKQTTAKMLKSSKNSSVQPSQYK